MKFKEWFDFNSQLLNCDLVVTILRNSYNRDCLLLEVLMKPQDVADLFGEYELKKVTTGCVANSTYITIKVILWPPTEKNRS